MLTKDLSVTFCGVKFPNPFCLSSSPVGNCYDMCAKAYDSGWGGIVFKTIGFFIANEVSPRFDHLTKEDTGFIGFKNMEQIAEHPLAENLAAIRQRGHCRQNQVQQSPQKTDSRHCWPARSAHRCSPVP